jgi:hypothetical protein
MAEQFDTNIVEAAKRLEHAEILTDSALDLGLDPRRYLSRERELRIELARVTSNWHADKTSRAFKGLRGALSDAHLTIGVNFKAERINNAL